MQHRNSKMNSFDTSYKAKKTFDGKSSTSDTSLRKPTLKNSACEIKKQQHKCLS